MKSKILILALAVLLGASAACFAEVKPATIFGSGMVLQRDTPLKVWGTADPREKVTVVFDGKVASAKADKAGRWSVTLPAAPAGGPFTMTVSGKSSKVEMDNILVGDVWLCSGQSNMEWQGKNSNDAEKEIAAATYPEIRCFTVTRILSMTPKEDVAGSWAVCSPETVGEFSAVGYFFARDLWRELKIPVGIVNSSWGGTDIEVWTSPESYAALPAEVRRTYNVEPGAVLSNPNRHSSTLYNAMIAPITGYKIKGAIWYQGESNAGDAYAYRTLFPSQI